MCGLCPDVVGGCDQVECGATPGHMTWFSVDDDVPPCAHVLAQHRNACAVRRGLWCDCYGGDEEWDADR